MNLSKEKLELFERLYKEENEAYARDESPNIPEFNDEEFLDEYRDWRIDAYEAPRNRKLDVELVRIYALEDIAEAEAALAAVEAMKKGGPDVMPMRTAKLEYFEDIYRADEEARKQKKPFDHEAFQSPDYREEYHNWKRDLKEKPMSKSHLAALSEKFWSERKAAAEAKLAALGPEEE